MVTLSSQLTPTQTSDHCHYYHPGSLKEATARTVLKSVQHMGCLQVLSCSGFKQNEKWPWKQTQTKDPFAPHFGEIEGTLLDLCLCILRVVIATREVKGGQTHLLFLPRAHSYKTSV